VFYAHAGHDLAAAPTAYCPGAPSAAHFVQGPFEESGAEGHDRVAHGEFARLKIKRSRRLDAPEQGVQFFILFRVGFVFF
jgi:hypothetical protein